MKSISKLYLTNFAITSLDNGCISIITLSPTTFSVYLILLATSFDETIWFIVYSLNAPSTKLTSPPFAIKLEFANVFSLKVNLPPSNVNTELFNLPSIIVWGFDTLLLTLSKLLDTIILAVTPSIPEISPLIIELYRLITALEFDTLIKSVSLLTESVNSTL